MRLSILLLAIVATASALTLPRDDDKRGEIVDIAKKVQTMIDNIKDILNSKGDEKRDLDDVKDKVDDLLSNVNDFWKTHDGDQKLADAKDTVKDGLATAVENVKDVWKTHNGTQKLADVKDKVKDGHAKAAEKASDVKDKLKKGVTDLMTNLGGFLDSFGKRDMSIDIQALLKAAIERDFDDVKTKMQDVIAKAGEKAADVNAKVQEDLNNLLNNLQGIWKSHNGDKNLAEVKEKVKDAIAKAQEKAAFAKAKVNENLDDLLNNLKDMWKSHDRDQQLADTKDKVNQVKGMIAKAGEKAADVTEKMKNKLTDLMNNLGRFWNSHKEEKRDLTVVQAKLKDIIAKAGKNIAAIHGEVKDAWNDLMFAVSQN